MWDYIRRLFCCDFTDIRCRNCKKIINNGTFIKYDKRYCHCLAGRYTPNNSKS